MKKTMSIALAAPIVLTLFSVVASAQSESRADVLKQIEAKRAELSLLEKKFLGPAPEDRAAYAEFLRQPDTGLIRLLPRETYDNDAKLTARGGGAFYSFTLRSHEYGNGTNIGLENGYFNTLFAGANYGMLTNLGEVSLDNITLADPKTHGISNYLAVSSEPEARVEQRRCMNGFDVDGLSFKQRLPVAVNSTYLLRSILYFNSDALVAFRVIRKDTDGSLILAWKLLRKYPVPELARNNPPQ